MRRRPWLENSKHSPLAKQSNKTIRKKTSTTIVFTVWFECVRKNSHWEMLPFFHCHRRKKNQFLPLQNVSNICVNSHFDVSFAFCSLAQLAPHNDAERGFATQQRWLAGWPVIADKNVSRFEWNCTFIQLIGPIEKTKAPRILWHERKHNQYICIQRTNIPKSFHW